MGVSLTQLNWQGRTLPVDAVLVSPETRETAVASSVDHHYGARLLYPSLAAVASGAGQAIDDEQGRGLAGPGTGAANTDGHTSARSAADDDASNPALQGVAGYDTN